MTCSIDERISSDVAQAVLGDKYVAGLNYYMYSDIYECSVRAVNPVTKEEEWSESIRLDTEDAVVSPVSKLPTIKYGGHWFDYYTNGIKRVRWHWYTLIVTIVLSMLLFMYLQEGGM